MCLRDERPNHPRSRRNRASSVRSRRGRFSSRLELGLSLSPLGKLVTDVYTRARPDDRPRRSDGVRRAAMNSHYDGARRIKP